MGVDFVVRVRPKYIPTIHVVCIIVCDSTKLDSSWIKGLHIEWLLLILAVDVVRRVCETCLQFGRQWLGGIAHKQPHCTLLALSITKVTRLIHVNPESINWYVLKEGGNL